MARQVCLLTTLVAVVFLLPCLATATGKTGEIAVFWGRNKTEGSLKDACDTGVYTTVIISFFSVFGHGSYWTDLSGHDVSRVGADIKHCQSKNILVLLSAGGDGYQYSLPTARSAKDVADHLWHAYLGGGRRGVFRPFGDAVLDGVDLYIDHGGPANYDVLVKRLAGYSGRGKPVVLTATPRCGYPDANAEAALGTGLVQRIHPRFYNDAACSDYMDDGKPANFWEAWDAWTSRFPASKVYVGLAAAQTTDGWINPESLFYGVMPRAQAASNYGGAMLWDRSGDSAYDGYYGKAIKSFV
ncbi:xylanase inhibitor protein 1-like [Oryza brachyantha]|uniref:xylanase inhibitor protein 1-like n=1 Tax=Oryza brachyantha TaxID=4533 RepID=UPI001ADC09BB|nr:xylanase inhibitor protein 1-like [Oryza brachyantha]